MTKERAKLTLLPMLLLGVSLTAEASLFPSCNEFLARGMVAKWQETATRFFRWIGYKDPTIRSKRILKANFREEDLSILNSYRATGFEHGYVAALDKEGNTLARSYHTSQDTGSIRGSASTRSYDELFADLRNRGINSGQVAEIHDVHTHPGQLGEDGFGVMENGFDSFSITFPSRFSRGDIASSYWWREWLKERGYGDTKFRFGIIFEIDDERAKKRIFEMRPQLY